MDLSKSFDCLPHDLLILKLESYGLSKSALNLLKSYPSNIKQCVKIGQSVSEMLDIYKGVRSKRSCGRQSTDLLRSINIAAKYSSLSNAFFQSSKIRSRVDRQPYPDLNAARKLLNIF
jgi:hypothetical protein